MEKLILKCECCGNSNESKIIEKYDKEEYKIYECVECTFNFIPKFYQVRESYLDYKDEEELQIIRNSNSYVKYRKNLLRFNIIKKFKKEGKLFDIGAGWGHFLDTGRKLGYDVSGIEMAKNPYTYAKEDLKLDIDLVGLLDCKKESKSIDIITMWDVYEHIYEVDEVAKKVSDLLKDNGYFLIQVPAIDSYFAKKLKKDWYYLTSDHVSLFSKKTITDLLKKHNLEVVKIYDTMEFKLVLLYVIRPWFRKKFGNKHKITMTESQNYFQEITARPKWVLWCMLLIHDLFYTIFKAINIGDEMLVVAKKVN